MDNLKPGAQAVKFTIEYAGESLTQAEICYELASEIWARLEVFQRDGKKPAAKRMSKAISARYTSELFGLKLALQLALGMKSPLPMMEVDLFLTKFQRERLRASQESGGA